MKYRLNILLWLCLFAVNSLHAQFAPAAGEEGSTAIAADDNQIANWAINCEVERGWQNIMLPDSGMVTNGVVENVPGVADNLVVSLGDGGMATVTFEYPVRNGEGWDFAVFENAFDDNFLELAFVEVSSDGEQFFRFPATSLTDITEQTPTFGLTDCTKINNLAGKYRGGYGTPFDLEELSEFSDQLDLEHITHVRIIDVVGSIDPEFGSMDADGRMINDPFPTLFPVGGFDLDAVAVIHQNIDLGTADEAFLSSLVDVFPNPVNSGEMLRLEYHEQLETDRIQLINAASIVKKTWDGRQQQLNVPDLPGGIYFLWCSGEQGSFYKKIVVNP